MAYRINGVEGPILVDDKFKLMIKAASMGIVRTSPNIAMLLETMCDAMALMEAELIRRDSQPKEKQNG